MIAAVALMKPERPVCPCSSLASYNMPEDSLPGCLAAREGAASVSPCV